MVALREKRLPIVNANDTNSVGKISAFTKYIILKPTDKPNFHPKMQNGINHLASGATSRGKANAIAEIKATKNVVLVVSNFCIKPESKVEHQSDIVHTVTKKYKFPLIYFK